MISYRKTYLDPDYRKDPKTDLFCCRCQKDIKTKTHRVVHLIEGGMWILHPEDEHLYESDNGDCGWFPIGNDCAKQVGLEFTKKV